MSADSYIVETVKNEFSGQLEARCRAITISGHQCKRRALNGARHCSIHLSAEDVDADKHSLFEQFWQVYPRKVAKLKARRIFLRLLQQGYSAREIIEGAKRYALERKGEDPRYTAHPSTWLNQGRWEDAPPLPDYIDIEPLIEKRMEEYDRLYADYYRRYPEKRELDREIVRRRILWEYDSRRRY